MRLALIALTFLISTAANAQAPANMTCTERQGACNRLLGQYGPEWGPKCKQAGDQCRRTGRVVAPYTGTVFENVPRR